MEGIQFAIFQYRPALVQTIANGYVLCNSQSHECATLNSHLALETTRNGIYKGGWLY